MLPQKIGRYQILEKLGSGGMAIVYLAQDASFERQVAIKVLGSNLGTDPDNRERFRREAKAIALIEHTAVVPVYEYGEDGELLYLVMRYMQGGSLKDRLSHGPVPLEFAAAVTARIASALDKAHSMGMIHRDIKPGNILFDLEENPYITDFGLVKLVEASVQLSHSEFFGTPAYTSPEQCQGEKNHRRARRHLFPDRRFFPHGHRLASLSIEKRHGAADETYLRSHPAPGRFHARTALRAAIRHRPRHGEIPLRPVCLHGGDGQGRGADRFPQAQRHGGERAQSVVGRNFFHDFPLDRDRIRPGGVVRLAAEKAARPFPRR